MRPEGGPIYPEAGLSIPRWACLSRGGPICPEADLSWCEQRRFSGQVREIISVWSRVQFPPGANIVKVGAALQLWCESSLNIKHHTIPPIQSPIE